ncbi:MAG: hypothetical protein OXS40_01070, partial [Gammaproteobacteria bacterium]|nr:hypothetical protein [Gammaproteobacteria bacterium]
MVVQVGREHTEQKLVAELLQQAHHPLVDALRAVTSVNRHGCYQPEQQLPGEDSHPARKARLSTAHEIFSMLAATCHWGTLSTVWMWYTPLTPIQIPLVHRVDPSEGCRRDGFHRE